MKEKRKGRREERQKIEKNRKGKGKMNKKWKEEKTKLEKERNGEEKRK